MVITIVTTAVTAVGTSGRLNGEQRGVREGSVKKPRRLRGDGGRGTARNSNPYGGGDGTHREFYRRHKNWFYYSVRPRAVVARLVLARVQATCVEKKKKKI